MSDFTELPSICKEIYAVAIAVAIVVAVAVAIKDQASHRIQGILVSNSLHTGTLITAFHKALHARNLINSKPDVEIIFHSDQGRTIQQQ